MNLDLNRKSWMFLLVDASSSMEEIKKATVDALQSFIAAHIGDPNTRLTMVQFTTGRESELAMKVMFDTEQRPSGLVKRTTVMAPTTLHYQPQGSTPLLAATMSAIDRMEGWIRPQDRALLIIATDGEENASKGVTLAEVRDRINFLRRGGNWTFAFLGADLDAWRTSSDMGVGALNALSWSPTDAGVQAAFAITSERAARWRKDDGSKPPERFYPLQLPAPKS